MKRTGGAHHVYKFFSTACFSSKLFFERPISQTGTKMPGSKAQCLMYETTFYDTAQQVPIFLYKNRFETILIQVDTTN